MKEADVNIVVSGTKNGILMVEGSSVYFRKEALEILKFGHDQLKPVLLYKMNCGENRKQTKKRI